MNESVLPEVMLNAAFVASVRLLVLPPAKYPLPPTVAALYAAVGANGLKGRTLVLPLAVIVSGLALLSMKRFDWQVSKLVLVIAVNGAVGGVKVEV